MPKHACVYAHSNTVLGSRNHIRHLFMFTVVQRVWHCCRTHPRINGAQFSAMPVFFYLEMPKTTISWLPYHNIYRVAWNGSAPLEYEGFRGVWRHQPAFFFHASCELYPQTLEPCPKPLFKHPEAQFVKCARAQNACVHTNKWTGSWGQACLDPGPGPLCENILSSLVF